MPQDVSPPDADILIVPMCAFGQATVPPFLYQRSFGRVVVDCADILFGRDSNAFENISRVATKHKWAVASKPIQGSLKHLMALAAWLGIRGADHE